MNAQTAAEARPKSARRQGAMFIAALCLALLAPGFAPDAAAQQANRPNAVLLVAKPDLDDPNFARSVVLVTQADSGETVAVPGVTPGPDAVQPSPVPSPQTPPPKPGSGKNHHAVEQLRRDLEAVFAAPIMAHATWGVAVRSLSTGEVLYERNPDKLMVPASNMTFPSITFRSPETESPWRRRSLRTAKRTLSEDTQHPQS